ncbi:ferredoxin/ferredoxin-NADP reductase [Corynebacterium renale]|uniref:Putative NAD(P)-binding protein n=1 Tax=Corynebacterium renale TaxID=1724 RepID=A0A2A9DPN2_9CORY|nr:NAD(P)-binding protein [Corynebacterium renale]PFG27880.1 putative NAD(P)-binding protein [Corynebacterium renale]SQG63400.1 ferredoxin/ferredoxin-NADP reductase [Corynebacterium renale]SQI21930.1 ferredoxin/ferredoxin-NADP reductase [Corynebacterium renale]STC99932.1 ferredoxin/ferredoxin-NADP reductase [Corynebacterium renale]
MTHTRIHVAVVGAGAAGLHAAQLLTTAGRGMCVDLYDKLPCPHALLQHATGAGTLRFVGNITVGRDVALAQLNRTYDAVISTVSELHSPYGHPTDILYDAFTGRLRPSAEERGLHPATFPDELKAAGLPITVWQAPSQTTAPLETLEQWTYALYQAEQVPICD